MLHSSLVTSVLYEIFSPDSFYVLYVLLFFYVVVFYPLFKGLQDIVFKKIISRNSSRTSKKPSMSASYPDELSSLASEWLENGDDYTQTNNNNNIKW